MRKNKEAEVDRSALRSGLASYKEDLIESEEVYRGRHADLHVLLKELREEIQALRGLLEENRYKIEKKIGMLTESEARRQEAWKNLDKSVQSSLDRIVRLEQYLGMGPSEKLVSAEPGHNGGDKKSQDSPYALYASAKQYFDQGEYEPARELFQAILKKYPKSKNADNAQFWLGEIYYLEKWYEKAILEYQKVLENYPKGEKVTSALLKQGLAFFNLGDKANARLILKELVRKHPDSNQAKIAKKKLTTLK